ncbi:MAG: phenylalanine--tRNA ligase subunit beta [Chitinophagaceae bacterium]|nr:phenylalanine--tRNA ligase subunit beta [Chitinophagaceae bacterium]
MKISYNWLIDYLPSDKPEPETVSNILTSVGLEVEKLEKYEPIRGGLNGLIIGEIVECIKHPEADNLKITKVDTGTGDTLTIVCGAQNVETAQKVVVAPVGVTIFPFRGEPLTLKKMKIRGIESEGMICAEDEIGIGESHAGIMVLPNEVETGTLLSAYYLPYTDWIFEIGLTPNRMDAMSHLGVAKDVCAWLSHKSKTSISVKSPLNNTLRKDDQSLPVEVVVENAIACARYSGVCISGVDIKASPEWMQNKLRAIDIRPVNNVVDITNFVLHETGQPLHAFDYDAIQGNKIIVKNLPANTKFITLDEKERKLDAEDLIICDGNQNPLCFGGVFGGLNSGVKNTTKNIFLESAWFDPVTTKKTALRHNLKTDASNRFEKGVDISNTVNALKRAAALIKEIAGGKISSEIIDVYPAPKQKTEVTLKNHYLKKISGKNYHADTIKNILVSLGFEILKEGQDDIRVAVPLSKMDVLLPADIIEEIMRIDGLDNIEIPSAVTFSPSLETLALQNALKEKLSEHLSATGFSEIFTNSITNSKYYGDGQNTTVKILNNLSADLDIMRPSLLETGLECIVYNINRKNNDLLLFEFGKTYSTESASNYKEVEHMCMYITGNKYPRVWNKKEQSTDIYFAKGICDKIFALAGITDVIYSPAIDEPQTLSAHANGILIASLSIVEKNKLEQFSIRQPVIFADIYWEELSNAAKALNIIYKGIPKFPVVERDLSVVVNKGIDFESVKKSIRSAAIGRLINYRLFDVFESEKVGMDKKSFAITFFFSDNEKTLTDKEIDVMMNKLIVTFEKDLQAQIRKGNNE